MATAIYTTNEQPMSQEQFREMYGCGGCGDPWYDVWEEEEEEVVAICNNCGDFSYPFTSEEWEVYLKQQVQIQNQ